LGEIAVASTPVDPIDKVRRIGHQQQMLSCSLPRLLADSA
jgi:hypothetical protein